MSKILNVLYQSDDNYALLLGVSLTSLFINNTDIDDINVYILNDNISEDNISKITKLCKKYNSKIEFIDTQPIINKLKELSVTTWRGGYTTWIKIFAINSLKLPTDRVLYIDCDTLITSSLAQLCAFDFESHILVMTYDCILNDYKEIINITPDDKYYNAGVILFNQKEWINNKCEDKIAPHLQNNRYFLNEQDVINILFRDKVKYLDIAYNFNSGFYIFGIDESLKIYNLKPEYYSTREEIEKAYENPVIHHCLGAMTGRPWEKDNIHPLNDLFDKYLALSLWSDYQKITVKRDFIFSVQRILFRILPKNIYAVIHKNILKNYLNKMNKLVKSGKS